MQKLLLTGGCGLVGQALTKELIRENFEVIILSRNPKNNSNKVTYFKWDPKKDIMDESALKEVDHIVHLAGAGIMDKRWTNSYKQKLIDSRLQSTKFLLESLRKFPHRVKTLIGASAVGYYGENKNDDTPFTEADPPADEFLG